MYMHNIWQPTAAKYYAYTCTTLFFSLLLVFFSHSLGCFLPIFVVCDKDGCNEYFTPPLPVLCFPSVLME